MQNTSLARAPISRYFALSAYWFGFSFHWFFLLPILMPQDVQRLVGEAQKGTYLGWLAGAAAVIPLVLPPFLGAWSDRLGKRMVFLVGGTAINVLGLVGMLLAPSFAAYAAAYLLVQLGNAIASSPYTALIPDTVPAHDRGRASGVMGFFQLFSQIAGGVAAFALGGSREGQYLAIIVVLSVTTLITYLSIPEPERHHEQSHLPLKAYLEAPYRDFRWVFLTRAFTETGRFAVQPFLAFYLADVIGRFQLGGFSIVDKNGAPDAGLALTLLLVALSVTAAITAIVSGGLSDRVGKRPVVLVASLAMAAAALGFALSGSYVMAMVMGLAFGLGYGAFVSVDWALGTSVLPYPEHHARDMGVWHIAMVFPQLFQGVFGQILDAGNAASRNGGYPILFGVAVLFFVLGGVFISRVRGVR
jgi:MFS family permease